MRYIGNKTRLLPFLLGAIRKIGLAPGTAHDAFAGTAAVGRALKADGWRVASSDLMEYSYVFQRAYVVASRVPSFADLRASDARVARAFRDRELVARSRAAGTGALGVVASVLADRIEPRAGFMTRRFSPRGQRRYFTVENAMRIDAAREALHTWRAEGLLSDHGYFLMLAALIEGADRVANTAGVYAAFIKSWQPNARRPLTLSPIPPIAGVRGSTAHRRDAASVARELGEVDLLYVDPPYNTRQYSGYYHVPELIARGWFNGAPVLRGKTGLPALPDTRSAWSEPNNVESALRSLLEQTGARHVLLSYNTEGLLPRARLMDMLKSASIDGRVRQFRRGYKRYRADRDRVGRRYTADRVTELLYYIRLR